MNKIKYFAYGSNMDINQMQNRCKSALHLCNAIKYNYELCFPVTSIKREGKGVASIRKKTNSLVEGVVYTITTEDLIILDGYEGKNYKRKEIFVETISGKILVWCYFAANDKKEFFSPSENYINTIIIGATKHKLSKKYIEQLKSYR